MTTIVWFRQDLRIADNPALAHAARQGAVLPVYILAETQPPAGRPIGGAALGYMMQVGRIAIARHEAELTSYAHDRLGELNWLKIHGTAPGKGDLVSFTMGGLHPHDVSTIIDRSGVAIRAGHLGAQPLMERFGVPAVCRASFGLYNTRAEVDVLAEALFKAHDFFA